MSEAILAALLHSIPGGQRQVIWRRDGINRRYKYDHDGKIGIAVGGIIDGRDMNRRDGECGIWLEQILPVVGYCAMKHKRVFEPVPASKLSLAADTFTLLRIRKQSLPGIVSTPRVYFDDPVDRRLA